MSIASRTPRHRRFKVTSNHLTRHIFEEGLRRPNVQRYVGVNHDLDGGSPHVQGCIELREARTVKQVESMWPVPVQVQLLVGTKGDRSSWARYVRYLTHESPAEQAKGKYHYPDSAFFASEGYDWRADVDALTRKEGYKIPLLDEIKLSIISGDRSAISVLEEHPELYARNYRALAQAEEHRRYVGLRKVGLARHAARLPEAHQVEAEAMKVPQPGPAEPATLAPTLAHATTGREEKVRRKLEEQRVRAERKQINDQEERDDLILACLESSEEPNEAALWSAAQNRISSELAEFRDASTWLGFTLDEITAQVIDGKFTLEGARMLGAYDYDYTYGSDGYLEDLLEDVRRELGRVA